jgi:Mce-associated membrane protein
VAGSAVFLALAVAATLTGVLTRGGGSPTVPTSAQLAALAAARSESVALTSISYRTATADIDRLLAGATGALRTQYEQEKSGLPATLAANHSSSAGQVLAAGLQSQSGDTAKVVLAVDATITGTDLGPQGTLTHYRVLMTMQRVDGRWLASQVAFVGQPQ